MPIIMEVKIIKSTDDYYEGWTAIGFVRGMKGLYHADGNTAEEAFNNLKEIVKNISYLKGASIGFELKNYPEENPLQIGTLVKIKHDFYPPYTGKLATILEIDPNRKVAKIKLQDYDDVIYAITDNLERVEVEETSKLKVYRWVWKEFPRSTLTVVGTSAEEAKARADKWLEEYYPSYKYILNTSVRLFEEDAGNYIEFTAD